MIDQIFQADFSPVPGAVMFRIGLGCYVAALLVCLIRPAAARPVAALGLLAHLAATVQRAVALRFFPLTNKMESFSAASLAVAVVILATWRNVRLYVVPLLAVAVASLAAALRFPGEIAYPPPLMRTIWYPLHVPLSFLAYGTWAAAAAVGLVWFRDRDEQLIFAVDRLALNGFALWSLAMICGGVWGVLAWGAYFLWDVKVVWSVILWFHYATFVHLRFAPPPWNRPALRVALAVVGFVWVFIAYVGTSFLFGRSSHSF
jgi:ABC-type transport system involved in cytochrome c biogenesis permease subunit